MSTGFQDWTRAIRLVAIDADGNPITILVDSIGRLYAVVIGEDADGNPLPVLTDSNGQIIMVPRGNTGNYMSVDADGNLTTVMKGLEGANLRTLAVDAGGKLEAIMKGTDGTTLRTVTVDSNGQIIMVPRGNTGNYMSVDADGNLTTVMKGLEGANLRTLAVDAGGKLEAIMKGMDGTTPRTVTVDSNGQIIMVSRGSTGNYMAIDSDGYMTAVLKGACGAALRTIKLDNDGRITAYMADSEDQWGQTLEVGLAEQAARLGSPVSWDRRGKVLVAHTFEHGLAQFRIITSGTGAEVALSHEYWVTGGYSCRLTAGSDDNHDVLIQAGLGKPPNLKLGLAARFSTYPYPAYITLILVLYSSGTGYRAAVRYDYDNEQIQYRDSAGNWQDAAAYKLEKTNWVMDSMKVVADLSTGKYMRLMLNSKQHDLTADVQSWAAAATGDFVAYQVFCEGHAAANDITYLDSVVVTVGEP